MSTRSIVTSHPDVACDVCGRRLLRGEHPDVFLAGGQRRNVCELCAPRAVDEGWLRESDRHSVSLPPARQRRARNLLGRLRQLRESPLDPAGTAIPPPVAEDLGTRAYDFFDGGLGALEPEEPGFAPEVHGADAGAPDGGSARDAARPVPAVPLAGPNPAAAVEPLADEALRSGDVKAQRALDVFNAGEHPRRIVGIARSLGAPSVSVRPLAESGSTVAIVIAWELCWYRYEVDLGDELAGASVVARGTELSELSGEDHLANAAAIDDGTLALVRSVLS
ncbi:MAG TPA: hypothetical protein VES65_08485 [Solirubrobacteraceae bacterium]|nr:hypothetical protein [Solirubrobacteraceae bacterium]